MRTPWLVPWSCHQCGCTVLPASWEHPDGSDSSFFWSQAGQAKTPGWASSWSSYKTHRRIDFHSIKLLLPVTARWNLRGGLEKLTSLHWHPFICEETSGCELWLSNEVAGLVKQSCFLWVFFFCQQAGLPSGKLEFSGEKKCPPPRSGGHWGRGE